MRIIAILMILTLSSCMVSKTAYDEMCAKNCTLNEQIEELKSENAAWLWKDQLCREHVQILNNELKAIKDSTKVIEETAPRP